MENVMIKVGDIVELLPTNQRQDAVVWWWPEFKTEESIPKVIRNQVGTEMENENWEDAYDIMAEYLAT